MAVVSSKTLIGKLVIKQGEHEFDIEIRQGNCLAVFIYKSIDKGKEVERLYLFFADVQHLDNIIKGGNKPFFTEEVVSIELNMKYKECYQLLKRLVKFYKVNCYYE